MKLKLTLVALLAACSMSVQAMPKTAENSLSEVFVRGALDNVSGNGDSPSANYFMGVTNTTLTFLNCELGDASISEVWSRVASKVVRSKDDLTSMTDSAPVAARIILASYKCKGVVLK
ncbi:hypothetical protein [Lonsdalea britannica]|uniref:hypothetical protein n=1 Tax=Lonsdalea britannica TaxID=1082704 RepID=UPI00111C12F8|nr:hypothetical protein [Lonsdalea britannica]